jgi:hypothetical protein
MRSHDLFSQTWNRYAYVTNNPVSFRDPTGLVSMPNVGTYAETGGGSYESWASSLLSMMLSSGAAVQCLNNYCGATPIPGTGGFGLPSYGADGSVNWSFSFPNVWGGVELTNAALAEALGLPTDDGSGDGTGGGPGAGASGGPPAGCNDSANNRSRFFTMLPILNNAASSLNVPSNFVVGLSSFESGWLDNHNYALQNLFGLTNAGGNNLSFPSFQASANYFVSLVSPYVQNAQTIPAFLAGLSKEGFNSVNPNYNSLLTNRINNIGKWEAKCGVK